MFDREETRKFSPIFLIVGIGFLAILLYKIDEVLNPLLLALMSVFVLFPLRNNPLVKRLIFATIFLLFIWFLKVAENLIFPFVSAIIFAYLFDPLIDFVESKGLKRDYAVYLLTFLLAVLVVGLSIIVTPLLVEEIQLLANQIPIYTHTIKFWFANDLFDFLEKLNIPTDDFKILLVNELTPKLKEILKGIFASASSIISGIGGVFNFLLELILTPILSFYFLKDWKEITKVLKDIFPSFNSQEDNKISFKKLNVIFSNYFRGQLIVSTIIAVLLYIFLSLIGVKYALILGILGGILNIIPYFGFVISMSLGIFISILGNFSPISLFYVILTYSSVQFLEGVVIGPKIVGDKLGLNPLLVLTSILVFPLFFGFIGLVIAVPLLAIIKVLFDNWYHRIS
ncbi:AI-2E family transporter [bacterium]|nr:AI-2E family transporter [bacterium]